MLVFSWGGLICTSKVYFDEMPLEDVDEMVHSEDTDQTAQRGAVLTGSAIFVDKLKIIMVTEKFQNFRTTPTITAAIATWVRSAVVYIYRKQK